MPLVEWEVRQGNEQMTPSPEGDDFLSNSESSAKQWRTPGGPADATIPRRLMSWQDCEWAECGLHDREVAMVDGGDLNNS